MFCSKCGMQMDDSASECMYCGAKLATPVAEAPGIVEESTEKTGNGNLVAGVVGAFLFALVGGLLYFLIYQMGFIAGIAGLAIFVLANFGYELFSKSKKKSVAGLIVSIIMTVVMIYIAEYLSVSFIIFQEYKMYEVTFFDAVAATPNFLAMDDVKSAVAGDLVYAYAFGLLAIISNVYNMFKGKKGTKKQGKKQTDQLDPTM